MAIFQLHLLVNSEAVLQFPYAGLAAETHRVLFVSEEAIVLINPADALYFESDYIPTSRQVEVDIQWIDHLVRQYIGPFEFNIIVRFDENRHITLTYHSPTNESAKDYDIYESYPEPRARQLVKDLYPIMEAIRDQAMKH